MNESRRTDEFGNVVVNLGDFELVYKDDGRVCTIMCRGNNDLFQRLAKLVEDEYGSIVDRKDSINGFGDDLSIFTPKRK